MIKQLILSIGTKFNMLVQLSDTKVFHKRNNNDDNNMKWGAYSELISVLLDQEVSILLGIILVSGRVIGHEIIIKVVVASQSHEEQTLP